MVTSISLLDPLLAPVVSGLVCTCVVFIVRCKTDTCIQIAHLVAHYTPPTSIPAFLSILFVVPIALTGTLASGSRVLFFTRTLVLYLLSLSTSAVAYRLSPLHPLAKWDS
jgi:hypothetical protein